MSFVLRYLAPVIGAVADVFLRACRRKSDRKAVFRTVCCPYGPLRCQGEGLLQGRWPRRSHSAGARFQFRRNDVGSGQDTFGIADAGGGCSSTRKGCANYCRCPRFTKRTALRCSRRINPDQRSGRHQGSQHRRFPRQHDSHLSGKRPEEERVIDGRYQAGDRPVWH